MASKRELRSRIVAAQSTKKITRAMSMVASVKMRKAKSRILETRPYAETVLRIGKQIRSRASANQSVFFAERETRHCVLLIIGSDKGLCGSFNTNVCRSAMNFIKSRQSCQVSVVAIGKKPLDFFKRRRLGISKYYVGMSLNPAFTDASKVIDPLITDYKEDKLDELWVIYNEFQSSSFKTVMQKMLPFSKEPSATAEESQNGEYIFEPLAEEILDGILVKSVLFNMWRALLESHASEQASRMRAMNGATKNATELIDKLSLQYNKARQAAITKELLEVVAGSKSLK